MNRHLIIIYCLVSALFVAVLVIAWMTMNAQHSPQKPRFSKASTLLSATVFPQKCPPNQFVMGFSVEGGLICAEVFASGSAIGTSPDIGNEEPECFGHGFIENGFCSCDQGWTGPECQQRKAIPAADAPIDNDHDNVQVPIDCDDNDDLVYPGAPDSMDGKDNDCDGFIDEGY